MKVNNSTVIMNKIISIIQIVFAGVNIFFWGVGGVGAFLITEVDLSGFFLTFLFCVIAGVILYCGIKRTKMAKALKNYVNVVGDAASISIKEIAQSVYVSEKQVVDEFDWLIRKNFLLDAYIDYNDNQIVFKEAYAKVVKKQQEEEQAKRNIEYISVVCECCNGTTKIEKGKEGVCSYCGAPIQ